jgi:hypothetical protein
MKKGKVNCSRKTGSESQVDANLLCSKAPMTAAVQRCVIMWTLSMKLRSFFFFLPNNFNIANSSSKGNFGDISHYIGFIYQYFVVHRDIVQKLVLYLVMYRNFVL